MTTQELLIAAKAAAPTLAQTGTDRSRCKTAPSLNSPESFNMILNPPD